MRCVAILACHVPILALNRVQAESIGLKSGVFLSKKKKRAVSPQLSIKNIL